MPGADSVLLYDNEFFQKFMSDCFLLTGYAWIMQTPVKTVSTFMALVCLFRYSPSRLKVCLITDLSIFIVSFLGVHLTSDEPRCDEGGWEFALLLPEKDS